MIVRRRLEPWSDSPGLYTSIDAVGSQAFPESIRRFHMLCGCQEQVRRPLATTTQHDQLPLEDEIHFLRESALLKSPFLCAGDVPADDGYVGLWDCGPASCAPAGSDTGHSVTMTLRRSRRTVSRQTLPLSARAFRSSGNAALCTLMLAAFS